MENPKLASTNTANKSENARVLNDASPVAGTDPKNLQVVRTHRYTARFPTDSVLRSIRDTKDCIVKGSVFNFIHRLEGRWSGETQEINVLAPGNQELCINIGLPSKPRAVSTKVSYDASGFWLLRETSAAEDGAATVHYLRLSPVSSGVLVVQVLLDHTNPEMAPPSASNITLREVANGAHLETRNSLTGQLSLFELIALSEDGNLTRTTNTYTRTGDLESIALSRQKKV